jgi:hypothetical protein
LTRYFLFGKIPVDESFSPQGEKMKKLVFALMLLSFTPMIHAQNGSSHSAVATWTAPSPVGGSGTIQGYNLYRSGVPATTFTRLNPSVITGTSFTDSTVVAGSSYTYAATTVDSAGNESVFSNQVAATVPTNPSAPSSLTIVVHSGEFKKPKK